MGMADFLMERGVEALEWLLEKLDPEGHVLPRPTLGDPVRADPRLGLFCWWQVPVSLKPTWLRRGHEYPFCEARLIRIAPDAPLKNDLMFAGENQRPEQTVTLHAGRARMIPVIIRALESSIVSCATGGPSFEAPAGIGRVTGLQAIEHNKYVDQDIPRGNHTVRIEIWALGKRLAARDYRLSVPAPDNLDNQHFALEAIPNP